MCVHICRIEGQRKNAGCACGGDESKAVLGGFPPIPRSFWQRFSLAFLYSALDLEVFPFPLIDLLEAATLSSVSLLACSSFLHFLYKGMGWGEQREKGRERGRGRDLGHC